MSQRFVIDSSWRHYPDKNIIIAGSPLKVFRVTSAAQPIIQALISGTDLPSNHHQLTTRFVAAGAIHPVSETPIDRADITVVIPAYVTCASDIARLQHLVDQLEVLTVVVVDDASPIKISLIGATVIRHSDNKGPGAARNTGAQEAKTPYIAFVDLDCVATANDLCAVASHFVDPEVGIVAPRVESVDNPQASKESIARYESKFSPLDMGPDRANVRPMTRVSYVPSAAVLVRASTFNELGGFDPSLRYGEDVDFVWRAIDTKWQCRYDPTVVCHHYNRASWAGIFEQRSSYGHAAAALYLLHPKRLAPLNADLATAASVAAIAGGFPLSALATGTVSAATLARQLRKADVPTREIVKLVCDRWIHTAYMMGTAVSRVWLPLVVLAAIFSGRMRRVLLLAFVVPTLWDFQKRKNATDSPVQLPIMMGLHVVDHSAYSFGVWKGILRARTLGPLVPRISVKRSTAD